LRWHYDPQRGTFRGWLYGITRNKLARFFQRQPFQAIGTGGSGTNWRLEERYHPDLELEACWEQDYQQQLFQLAAARIRVNFAPTTWQAFWRTAVEGMSPADAARDLGLSIGAVYVARSRILARLAKQIEQMQMK